MQPPAAATGDCPAESPPFPRLRVDTDDPARLRITHTTRDQQRKPSPLITLRRPARPSATRHRNPRTVRVLRRSLESAEPTPADVGPRRATISHDQCSYRARQATSGTLWLRP